MDVLIADGLTLRVSAWITVDESGWKGSINAMQDVDNDSGSIFTRFTTVGGLRRASALRCIPLCRWTSPVHAGLN